MDNDMLINEARRLYAVLSIQQYVFSIGNKVRFDRLDRLVDHAYTRYQRRLNRCVLCYLHCENNCLRDMRTVCCKRKQKVVTAIETFMAPR